MINKAGYHLNSDNTLGGQASEHSDRPFTAGEYPCRNNKQLSGLPLALTPPFVAPTISASVEGLTISFRRRPRPNSVNITAIIYYLLPVANIQSGVLTQNSLYGTRGMESTSDNAFSAVSRLNTAWTYAEFSLVQYNGELHSQGLDCKGGPTNGSNSS